MTMTNAELIAKIRAEIERQMKLHDSFADKAENEMIANIEIGAAQALDDILSFLDTLQEQDRPEPYNPTYDEAYLNEKIKKATESWKGVDVNKMLAECRGYDEPEVDLEKEIRSERKKLLDIFGPMNGEQSLAVEKFARHFYNLGLQNAK